MPAKKKKKAQPVRKAKQGSQARVKARPKVKPKATLKPKAKPKPIPDGYRVVTPGFRGPDCHRVIEFLQRAFGAKVVQRFDGPDGRVMHCELRFGDSIVMCGEAPPEQAWRLSAMLYVKDCDAVFQKAVDAGAIVKEPPRDQFYGDRNGRLLDPSGNEWIVATHKEDVSRKEMDRRMQALTTGGGMG